MLHEFFKVIFLIFLSSNSVLIADDLKNKDLAIHYFMQGEFLLNQGNYALAVLEFQDALDIDPNSSTIHVSIADAYRRLGRSKRAEDHLKIAIDLDPKDMSGRELLGQLYLINRQYEKALIQFLALSKIDEKNDNYLTIIGDLNKLQKQWDTSINFYLKAYEVNPQNFKALESAMQVSLSAEFFKKAEEVCKKLIYYDSNNASYWLTYKQITAYNKNYESTLLAISELERINGKTTKLTLEKSAVMQELNDIDSAIKILLETHNPDSTDLDLVKRLVALYIENENYIDANIFNEVVLSEFPNDLSGYINAAIISLNNDSPEEAIKYLEPNIDKYIDNFSALYLLGTSYFQIKNLSSAEQYLNLSLKVYPQSRSSKHTLAMIYDQTGQWMKSDSLYLDLIKTDSKDAQAYNNFAYSLVERKANLELALEMSLIANKIQPDSAPYLDTLGWIYFHLEQYEKSLEYVQKSYSIDSTNPIIVEHLADILKATNQISKANLIYLQAIDQGGDSLQIKQKMLIE